jgi:hypothetical protein
VKRPTDVQNVWWGKSSKTSPHSLLVIRAANPTRLDLRSNAVFAMKGRVNGILRSGVYDGSGQQEKDRTGQDRTGTGPEMARYGWFLW